MLDFDKSELLTIDDKLLCVKYDINSAIKKLLNTMIKKESCDGDITLKLKIHLHHTKDYIIDNPLNPVINYKVTISVPDKKELDGTVSGDNVLATNEDGDYYIRPAMDDQIDMFNDL